MRNVKLYLLFSFGLCWAVAAVLYFSGFYLLPYGAFGLSLCMLAPALSVLLTKLITREGWADIRFKPQIRAHWRWYLLGCFSPSLCVCGGVAVYFLLNPADYAAGSLNLTSAAGLLMAMVISPLVNLFFCAGEELGWRGYLWPQLRRRYSSRQTMLLVGLIWGLWHAPMIAMGHNYGQNYGGWPWLGIVAMIFFCFFLSCIFGVLTQKSGCFWPAALAHGSINGTAGLGLMFMVDPNAANPFVGPVATGYLGGSVLILAGLICFVMAGRGQRSEVRD